MVESFDDCDLRIQAELIAYERIREYEEQEELTALMGGRVG